MTEALLLTKSKQLRTSNDSIVLPKPLAILSLFRGNNAVLLFYGPQHPVLEDILQKSVFPLYMYWRGLLSSQHSNEGWMLTSRFYHQFVTLRRMGHQSPFIIFFCLLCYKCLNSPCLKILELLPGGWVESLMYSLRWVKNKYYKFEQSFLHPFTSW